MKLEVSLPHSQELANCLFSEPDQPRPYPYPTIWRSILILSSHLRLGLPSDLFPSGFPTKTLYTSVLYPIRATCSSHFILLDLTILIIFCEEYISLSSSLRTFLHCPVTSSPLGPNILLFSRSPRLGPSLNVRDQVSQPHKTTDKIIILQADVPFGTPAGSSLGEHYQIL